MKHPNAVVGFGSGAVLGNGVVELLELFGVHISSNLGALIGAGAAGLVLLVGRKGIRGVARQVWRGTEK